MHSHDLDVFGTQHSQGQLMITDRLQLQLCACSDLSLDAGLVDDDFGMELLVDGRIISLSLPVRAVFESVWLPAVRARGADRRDAPQAPSSSVALPGGRDQVEVIGPPMPVTYRLQVSFPTLPTLAGIVWPSSRRP